MTERVITDEDVGRFREVLMFRKVEHNFSDDQLRDILVHAMRWVGRIRYSRNIVGMHMVKDGYPHA